MKTHKSILESDINTLAAESIWSEFADKTILLTGATGLLGAHSALAAVRANEKYGYSIKIIAVCRDKDKARAILTGNNIDFVFQDIREPLRYSGKVDYVFHFAGAVGPAVFENNPVEVLSSNASGTLNLLKFANEHGCQGFAFSSTHEVYGNTSGECKEDTPLVLNSSVDPRSCYILGKQFAENALACYSKQYGLKTFSFRFSRIIGTLMNMDSGLFVCDFITNWKKGEAVKINGNPNLLRPLCYVTDAVAAVLYGIIKGESGQTYNVQGAECPTIKGIANIISNKVTVIYPEKETAEKVGHWLNCDKLRNLGWEQKIPLIDGVQRIKDFYGC